MNHQNTATQIGVRQWLVDSAHSEIGFSVTHLMISRVRGNFSDFSGTASFDPDNLEHGSIEVEIDAASIDTRDEDRDGHLRSEDFFDVEQYPVIRFASTSVEPVGSGGYNVHGELTIKGETRPVTLNAKFSEPVPDPFGGTRIGASAETKVNRSDFGLTWNQALETGGVLVGDEISISINAQLVLS